MKEKQSKKGKMQKEEYVSTFHPNQLKMTLRQVESYHHHHQKKQHKQPQDKLIRKSKRWGDPREG